MKYMDDRTRDHLEQVLKDNGEQIAGGATTATIPGNNTALEQAALAILKNAWSGTPLRSSEDLGKEKPHGDELEFRITELESSIIRAMSARTSPAHALVEIVMERAQAMNESESIAQAYIRRNHPHLFTNAT